jgi:hypothetical protein
LKDPGIDGRIILKWIFEKRDKENGLDQCGQVASCCECGNKLSGSTKFVEFFH